MAGASEAEKRAGQDKPYDKQAAFAHIAGIGETLKEIYALAEQQGIATSAAADRLAARRHAVAPDGG